MKTSYKSRLIAVAAALNARRRQFARNALFVHYLHPEPSYTPPTEQEMAETQAWGCPILHVHFVAPASCNEEHTPKPEEERR